MSLRDALVKAGAVSKKRKAATERELKRQRKKKQGSQERKGVVARRERDARKAAEAKRLQAVRDARQARHAVDALHARGMRVLHLLTAHRQQVGMGRARFYFVGLDGLHVQRLWVPWKVARGLRAGALAICALEHRFDQVEYVVVPRAIALNVRALKPAAVRFLNDTPADPEDPQNGFIDDLGAPERPAAPPSRRA
jgi:uncharacterized protein YaiL (DUF2058 family)